MRAGATRVVAATETTDPGRAVRDPGYALAKLPAVGQHNGDEVRTAGNEVAAVVDHRCRVAPADWGVIRTFG